jgi:hypothetical protein
MVMRGVGWEVEREEQGAVEVVVFDRRARVGLG